MAQRRIFLAVDISEEARRNVVGYIHELKGRFAGVSVKWEQAEKLHLTLKFLGPVDEHRIAKLETAIRQVVADHAPFAAELSGTGVFGSAREPRILWIGMGRGRDALLSLAGEIEAAMEHLGFPKDPRQFNPHLTIGRIRQPREGKDLTPAHLQNLLPPFEFSVNDVTIYESVLNPQGSIYEVISRVAL
jgi:2'-5' RNA ligase